MARNQIKRLVKYTEPAIERIRKTEAKSIIEFCGEVSHQAVTQAVTILRNPPGFRPNSEQGVRRKVQLLANRLVGDKSRKPENIEQDFDVLGFVWISWGMERLGNADAIDDYLSRSQALELDKTDGENDEMNGDDPLALELFEKLHDSSYLDTCGRSDVKRFFEFSPFDETERLRNIIESCKLTTAVLRDRKIAALPSKVEKIEQEIADLRDAVDALSNNNKVHGEKLSALQKEIESLQEAVSEGSESKLEINNLLDEVQSEMASQKERFDVSGTTQEKLLQDVTTSIKKLQSDLVTVADQIEPLSNKSEKADKAITNISSELEQIRKLITEFRTIVNRVSAAARPIDAKSDSVTTEARPPITITLEKLQWNDPGGDSVALLQMDEILGAVTINLECLGIKKSSAEALALDCIAALMAGHMPYLGGMFGKRVAEACALALAAQETYVLTVPVGITAPHEFRRQLGSLSVFERQEVGCVIIDGINRSAFDTFGECLIDIVSCLRSGDHTTRSMLIMATFTDGPASLPLSIEHVSLGPVFYTDALDWRSRPKAETQMSFGGISTQVWQEAYSVVEDVTSDSEEALRLLGEFVPFANPLLRGTILSAFRTLSALRNNRAGPTPLQSLSFGWIAPLCIALGTTVETVDQEFDQGIVDGTTPDIRLTNLLRSGLFGSTKNGGY